MTRVLWTKAEDDLIALWPLRTDAQIAAMIPRRTVQAVTMRRKRLGRVRRRKSGLAARVSALEAAVLELMERIEQPGVVPRYSSYPQTNASSVSLIT